MKLREFFRSLWPKDEVEAVEEEEPVEVKNIDRLYNVFPDPILPFGVLDTHWDHFILSVDKDPRELDANRLNMPIIRFLNKQFGGFKGKKILELGPFEGFHTHDLDKLGAAEILAIEGNPRNFLKCLIVKNHYQLNSARYLLGDFTEYLLKTEERYDFILAAGVLYHSAQPMVLLDQIMSKTDAFGICTTVHDPDKTVFKMTGQTREVIREGAEPFVLHERENPALRTFNAKFGMEESAWLMSEQDLLRYMAYKNFRVVQSPSRDNLNKAARIQFYAERIV